MPSNADCVYSGHCEQCEHCMPGIEGGVSKRNLMPARVPEEVAAEIIRDEIIGLLYGGLD